MVTRMLEESNVFARTWVERTRTYPDSGNAIHTTLQSSELRDCYGIVEERRICKSQIELEAMARATEAYRPVGKPVSLVPPRTTWALPHGDDAHRRDGGAKPLHAACRGTDETDVT